MNKDVDNVIYALWLTKEVRELTAGINQKYNLANVAELPYHCFLWVGDRNKRNTWYLPYRAGTGSKAHGVYESAGAVSIAVLRAVSEAVSGDYPSSPTPPHQIKTKIKKLLKEYSIKEYKGDHPMKKTKELEFNESSISGQFKENKIDKENRLVSNVAIMREDTGNIYIPGSVKTNFTEDFRREVAELVSGKKIYADHASELYLKEHKGVRSVRDVVGFYENGRLGADGIVRADIRYLSNQKNWFEPLIDEMSDKIGLSIVAGGTMVYDPQTKIAEAIKCTGLRSVDLVTEPGSTANLYESKSEEPEEEEEKMDLSKLTMAELMESRPEMVTDIQKKVTENLSKEGEVAELKTKITDLEESNKKIKAENDDYKVAEAVAEKTEAIDKVLKESKIPEEYITETFKTQLIEAKDDEARKAIIEDRQALLKGVKPGKKTGVKGMGDETHVEESEDEDTSTDKEITNEFKEAMED